MRKGIFDDLLSFIFDDLWAKGFEISYLPFADAAMHTQLFF